MTTSPTDVIQPAWTPDGKTIGYLRDGAIWTTTAARSTQLTSGKDDDSTPAWRPVRAEVGSDGMATVVLLGTLDTKGNEYAYLRERLREQGVDVAARRRGRVRAAGRGRRHAGRGRRGGRRRRRARSREAGDRGAAVEAMCRGLGRGRRAAARGGAARRDPPVGGSGNSSIGAAAMRALPVGVPKLIVSTVASGDTRPYVGATDVSMTYSVVDISGLNRISERILSNAAGAIAGMAKVRVARERRERGR